MNLCFGKLKPCSWSRNWKGKDLCDVNVGRQGYIYIKWAPSPPLKMCHFYFLFFVVCNVYTMRKNNVLAIKGVTNWAKSKETKKKRWHCPLVLVWVPTKIGKLALNHAIKVFCETSCHNQCPNMCLTHTTPNTLKNQYHIQNHSIHTRPQEHNTHPLPPPPPKYPKPPLHI